MPALLAAAVEANLDALVRIAELFQEVLKGGTLRGDDHEVDQLNYPAWIITRSSAQRSSAAVTDGGEGGEAQGRIAGTLSGQFCSRQAIKPLCMETFTASKKELGESRGNGIPPRPR